MGCMGVFFHVPKAFSIYLRGLCIKPTSKAKGRRFRVMSPMLSGKTVRFVPLGLVRRV